VNIGALSSWRVGSICFVFLDKRKVSVRGLGKMLNFEACGYFGPLVKGEGCLCYYLVEPLYLRIEVLVSSSWVLRKWRLEM